MTCLHRKSGIGKSMENKVHSDYLGMGGWVEKRIRK